MLMVFGCCASFFRRKRHQIHCEQGHFTVKSFTWNSFGSRDYFFWTPKTNVVGWWMVFFLVNKTNWMWPCLTSTVVCWLHTTNISWHRLSFACISTSFCLMRFEYTQRNAWKRWAIRPRVNRYSRLLTGNSHKVQLYFNVVKS